MRAYVSILRLRFMLLIQYRVAAIAGICTQFLFGFVRVMIIAAFYASTTATAPMSYGQSVTYIWISQALLGMLPWNGDAEIQEMISSGNVAYELCRPLDLYNHWFCRAFALRTAPTLLRAIPLFVVTLFFLPQKYSMQPPNSFASFAAWILVTFGALMLSCSITNLLNISMLWTVSGDGIKRLLPSVVMIFSGMIVPLPLFPNWMQQILRLLPFSGLVDTPMRFYLGHIKPSSIVPFFFHQITWTCILILYGKWLISRGLKRVEVQGG
jgi:ABC-2 type transport system permease protein